MKIRIKGNSLRYRLTRSDVNRLAESGCLEDKVDFPGSTFSYVLQLTDDEQLASGFSNNTITLYMPKQMLKELANTDKVGFENTVDNIFLLVEKDFTCLDNVDEDQSDNYPNPLAERIKQ